MKKSKEELLRFSAEICKNTLMETLQIEFVDITDSMVIAKMPVTPRVHQPDGVLHGGASVALAESVGSAAAFMLLDSENIQIRGIEIAANHIKSVKDGVVYAKAKNVHKGKTTQLWQIDIVNEADELVSSVKMTTLTLNR
ncbi:MAG TPA: hotdog fold thioesterase [Flavobacteriaceae bacterium]|nr:hotdog fold thioesterase [Flavobacteriaceae bacterium]MCB9212572.1 hotdog fold thioesterase [Alteromonas sp.]HPF10640.1 hotdog fold thioesterase [Flavobacteriaceae bacterium]HQU20922.1 hotdog fold thioesterase [Flavobacteriaceae bacterium]HQU64406.1 hotdog fold thioesterase [Flavobacteriaceae bacterium]